MGTPSISNENGFLSVFQTSPDFHIKKKKKTNPRKQQEYQRIQASQGRASRARSNWRKLKQWGSMSEAHAPSPSLAQPATYAAKGRSRPVAAKRDGGGVGLLGTGSPRKTLALLRWIQHEMAEASSHQSCTL